MSEVDDIYQEIILEHHRKPRNFRKLEDANRTSDGYNPFCGDKITLYLKLDGDIIADVGFQGSGCAISRASSSMMTQSIKGKTVRQAEEIFTEFHDMLTLGSEQDFGSDTLGDLEMLSGVAKFPTRVKCATLSWHTLHAAIKGEREPVSTE